MDTQQNQAKKHTSRVLFWSLVAGIVVVLNLFFNYSASLFFDEPKFETYCPIELTSASYRTKDECVLVGGSWAENTYPYIPEKTDSQPKPIPTEAVTGWCNATYTCQQGFDDAGKIYDRNIFIVLVIFGIIAIVLGFVFATVSAVSLGLSLGGVLSLIIGAIRYWSDMNDVVRVIVLAVALIVLIWLGIKKIKE